MGLCRRGLALGAVGTGPGELAVPPPSGRGLLGQEAGFGLRVGAGLVLVPLGLGERWDHLTRWRRHVPGKQ